MTADSAHEIARNLAVCTGAVLCLSATLKLADGRNAETASTSLFTRWLPPPTVRPAWLAVAGVEGVNGVLLILLPGQRWPAAAATVLMIGAAGLVEVGRRVVPQAGCGCFGAASSHPMALRTTLRAALMAGAAAATAVIGPHASVVGRSPAAAVAGLAFAATFVLLSPEAAVGVRWLRVGRHAPRCATSRLAVEKTLAELHDSTVWRNLRGYLRSLDHSYYWRQGCWRFFEYDALYEGQAATAIFAVRLPPGRPALSGAIVDAARQVVHTREEQ